MPAEERSAYLVSRYPAVTHTFIAEEVRALRALGVEIRTAAVRAEPEQVLSAADESERRRTHYLLPVAPWTLAVAHARAFARAPRAYLRTLAAALRRSQPSRLWQFFYFAEAMLLWRWMDREGLRHVHVHFPNVAADVADLATAYGGAGWTWSITLHGPTEFADPAAHRLGEKVAAATAVIVISEFTRAEVEACSPRAAWDKLRVIHCGIDVERFAPAAAAAPTGPVRLLTVAALQARKGHRDLLAALAALRADGAGTTLTLVGRGPEREALEAEVARLGLGDAVRFAGAVAHAEMHERYAQADVFVLPSHAEGVPIVLMEAMASGLPVIATRINGIPELVIDGETGLLVDPGDPAALRAAIERLTADPALRAGLAAAGRAHVAAHYELGASARAVREVLATSRGG